MHFQIMHIADFVVVGSNLLYKLFWGVLSPFKQVRNPWLFLKLCGLYGYRFRFLKRWSDFTLGDLDHGRHARGSNDLGGVR